MKCVKDQQIHFSVMDLLLLYYCHQHVLASPMAITMCW